MQSSSFASTLCVSDKIGTENCKSYDGTNYKPIGLLQKYGERPARPPITVRGSISA